MERVLIVGATGNIGVAATIAALRTKRSVLAIVRNQNSAEKLFKHVGSKEGITTVEADVKSENGVQGVVDQVKAGKLPAFQHVYTCVGLWMPKSLHEISMAEYREVMSTNLDANFFAYRATIPYLLQQNNPNSTWTVVTGGAGTMGSGGVTAVTQGGLFSLCNAAARENERTNIRINEAYLNARVDFDSVAEENGTMKASEYAECYEQILERKDVRGRRVTVAGKRDLGELRSEDLI